MADRFEVWIRDVKVASSDNECFVRVLVEGKEVFNMEAQIDFEPLEDMKYGARPRPIGFSAKATAKKLDGSDEFDMGERKWQTMQVVEVT